MTRFKDTGSIALIDTRPSEHKGLKPPAITPQPKEDKEYGRNKQSNFNRKPRCKTRG